MRKNWFSSILIYDYLIAKLAYNSTSYKSDECKNYKFLGVSKDRMTAEQAKLLYLLCCGLL